MSADRKIRIGVLGVGYLGRFHALRYKEVEGAELVGVADADHARAESVAKEAGCAAFKSNRELLERVDAVSIAAPTPQHHAVAREALLLDRDILLEKPVTMTVAEAEELVRLGKERKRIFMVGHLERFNPAFRGLAGAITRPAFIEARRMGPFKERAANIDVVRDLMIHDIDLVLSLVKSGVERISATGAAVLSDKIDIAEARLEFANGAVANLTASRVNPEGVRKMLIFQPESCVSVDFQKKETKVFKLGKGEPDNPMSRIKGEKLALDNEDALKMELASFVNSVATRSEPLVAGEDGMKALDVALAVNREIALRGDKFLRAG